VITKEEDQNLLKVTVAAMIIAKVIVIMGVMDIITIKEKERVEVSSVVK
jgi:predicted SPOUT superfamily RNA methylase MTH1